jgi:cell division ATPase FtsA
MSLFGISHSDDRYGVVIDIGSGSVLAAIVHSHATEKHPTIVWSHREHAPLRNVDSLEQSSKAVMTALVNAAMLLDSEGRKALYNYNSAAALTEMQCGISAPWSYTVTKTINYKQEELFVVTRELIDELSQTINEKIHSELRDNESLQKLGLEVVSHATMEVLSNGYRIEDPDGGEATSLLISRASTVTQQYLINALDELREKLFPKATIQKFSFILLFYATMRELFSKQYDLCLVDITFEATEIGIIRDGVLTYSTHTPFGSFSLAREIAEVTAVPLHEAFGYLHTDKPYSFMIALNKEKREEVEKIFEAYTERVSQLFHETGDELSIPKQIALHADIKSETLFMDLIERAAKRAIKSASFVTTVSIEIMKRQAAHMTKPQPIVSGTDTALLLSAEFFHMQPMHDSFEYL